jgi:hypothetical protein
MAAKKLKPKWNSTQPNSVAPPPASAFEAGEFGTNRNTGWGYFKKNDGTMQDVGPVKSVNGETGDTVISSDDIPGDGATLTASGSTVNSTLVKNGKIVVVDASADITITVGNDTTSPCPLYTQILFCQKQAGRIEFLAASGVTLLSLASLRKSGGAGSMCVLVKVAANTWMLGGTLS